MSEETPESRAETNGYLLGISVGWAQAANYLLDRAAECFRADRDDDSPAHLLRDHARACLEKSETRRKEYEEHKNKEYEDERIECSDCLMVLGSNLGCGRCRKYKMEQEG